MTGSVCAGHDRRRSGHAGKRGAAIGLHPARAATARKILPRPTRMVALLDDLAPAELVAAVLTAGADVCVRGGQPAILAGHLVACRRRQLADRWASLHDAVTAAMRV